ncbi:hypothetical protein GW864_02920 [bacterium]|nr:hypothetical protein [bacterium]
MEIYLYPSFKAGTDTLYVSVPGIDPVKIPITVEGGTAQKVTVTLDKETATPGETITAKIKVTDIRDNPISQAKDLKI